MTIGGIVLCGGQSKRMGSPKAWLPFGDEMMLPRIVRILREEVEPVIVVAAPDQEVPPLPLEIQIVRDPIKGRGPLQGLAVGLTALRDRVDAIYLSSCDVPFLDPRFIRRMIELLGNRAIAMLEADGYQHPLAAVYRISVLDAVHELLAADRPRPALLAECCPTRLVSADELLDIDPKLQSLRNVNCKEDYEKALVEWNAHLLEGSSKA